MAMVSLEKQLKEIEQRAIDLDWEGHDTTNHWRLVAKYRERIANGELEEPDH